MGKYAKAVIATEIVVKKERRFFNHNRNTTDEVLKELEKIDIEQFKKETAMYNDLIKGLDRATSQEELKEELNNIYQKMGWKKPWEGDFDDFMTNSNKPMVFE